MASHTNIVFLEMEEVLEPKKTTEIKQWASSNLAYLAVLQTKYFLPLYLLLSVQLYLHGDGGDLCLYTRHICG